ncbi:hypothetical protein M5362_24610 [Streptomyces sp. Je 1-79]|uniref:hypothetical protein n=1 Tax=Streptomyces sp. Je 1-79 TaxID=2943847 RepID=UPI0021A8E7C0|nr:hypothetical protein [Streptomyces sp. Je 1-79]MCT4356314.1 hypothetical protein [Streptomyces sp. Je 1-79]
MGESTHAPGEGPTHTKSVSFHLGTTEAVNARVGSRGFSSYVEQAVQRQIERDNLAELIAANEEIHGSLTSDEIEAARLELGEARRRAAAGGEAEQAA